MDEGADLFGAMMEKKAMRKAGRTLASLIKTFYEGLVAEELPIGLVVPLLSTFTATLTSELLCKQGSNLAGETDDDARESDSPSR